MSNYQLKLHVEKPDTVYKDPKSGKETPSGRGHVWYEVIKPDGTSSGWAGFAPVDPKNTPLPVLGEVKFTDGSAYAGEPYSTTTYKITQAQADKLMDFSKNPTAYGFSLTYWAGVAADRKLSHL